jgi:hypothetical protein
LAGFGADLKGCAAGAAFVVGEADAVDVGFVDAGEFADYFGDFGGGSDGRLVYGFGFFIWGIGCVDSGHLHVLALPAESITETVEEVPASITLTA